ncbi:MAG: phosphoribosyl-ATP diphosphatase [Gemmatimonadales bacterium]
MLIPSIDLRGGKAVQLRQGRDLVLTAGEDPRDLAARFGRAGQIAVIDLDAALGTGDNEALVADLCGIAICRVGGGIRDREKARRLLKAGAHRLIIGTAATAEFLAELPRRTVLVAVDAWEDRVVDRGWTATTNEQPIARAQRLAPLVAGFLYTIVEREGMAQGADMERFGAFRAAVAGEVTVAGGITQVAEVAALDRAGMDAQVGMALYTGALRVADGVTAALRRDEAVPTVVQDVRDGRVLIVARSTRETLAESIETGDVVLHSRTRGRWRKGATSGDTMRLMRVELDCDRDAVLMHVVPVGPACHTGAASCFGDRPFSLGELERVIGERARADDASSYTRQLLADAVTRRAKIIEEAAEVVDARTKADLRWEAADLVYHTMVHLVAEGLTLRDLVAELGARRR